MRISANKTMTQTNKQNEFYSWILGEGEFPFFKNLPKVKMPDVYREEQGHDCKLSPDSSCLVCEKIYDLG